MTAETSPPASSAVPNGAALVALNITKRFRNVVALDQVSVSLVSGRVHAIVGENGAGKSTIASIMCGAISPDEGNLLVDGVEREFRTPLEAIDSGVALVYQELSLATAMSVADNVLYRDPPRRFKLIDMKARSARVAELLERVGASGIRPEDKVGDLMLAHRQLVEVARALAHNPRVLIFDEPTSALHSNEADHLLSLISSLASDGVAIGYISHRLDELFQVADDFTVLRDGSLIWTRPVAEVTRETLLTAMVGREVNDTYPELPPLETGEPVLSMDSYELPGTGPEGISMHVGRGEIVGLAGLVGSGRSRIARALVGVEPRCSGTISISGESYEPRSPRHAAKRGIALVPEDRKIHGLLLELSLQANVVLPSLKPHSRFGVMNTERETATAETALERMRVKFGSRRDKASDLSGGNQQKVVLGKWLAKAPALLILDEPTRGIDVNAKHEIYVLLTELAAQGLAILMISSDLPEVLAMSHRVYVLRDGDVVKEFSPPYEPDAVIGVAAMAEEQ